MQLVELLQNLQSAILLLTGIHRQLVLSIQAGRTLSFNIYLSFINNNIKTNINII